MPVMVEEADLEAGFAGDIDSITCARSCCLLEIRARRLATSSYDNINIKKTDYEHKLQA